MAADGFFLNSYLQEYLWRDRSSKNAFEALCHFIAAQYLNKTFGLLLNINPYFLSYSPYEEDAPHEKPCI